MIYKVTKKYARGSESPIGNYKNINDANKVIQEKLADDAAHKVTATYCLYEGFDLMEEYDQSKLVKTQEKYNESSSSSGRAGSSQSFNPNPFSMTPTPKGMPKSWIQEEDKDKKDDKK